jgi:hypothetical protein
MLGIPSAFFLPKKEEWNSIIGVLLIATNGRCFAQSKVVVCAIESELVRTVFSLRCHTQT